jgi:LIVCS family branched-chain amino acid:cation transporter
MHLSPHISFYKALSLGTHTLDLFASFFFACILIPSFKKALKNNKNNQHMNFFTLVTSSCFIGMGLLSMIYLSLIGLSCKYHNIIKTIQTGEELPAIAGELVGKIGAITAAIAIIFACLTTAIALAVVFSEFIEKEILKNKIPYILILFITMSITCGLASLGFDVIVKTIGKMLLAIYPATCILFICNLAKKTIGFPWVKIPFYITLLISLPKRYFCG